MDNESQARSRMQEWLSKSEPTDAPKVVEETATPDVEFKSPIVAYDWQEIPQEWLDFINTPMTYADIRLFFGDQGQGKSVSTVACVVDDVTQYATQVVTPEGEILKVRALNEQEQLYLETPVKEGGLGIKYNHLKHMRLFNDTCTKSKIVEIPPSYIILSPVKVFSNRTFYGIEYVPFDLENFMRFINTPVYTNGWIVLSESVLLGKENGASYVEKFMKWFGAECRKRHMKMAVDMQYRSQLAPIFHLYATTVVECSYDEDTSLVTLDVNKKSPVMGSTDYISKYYRRFYKSDELMAIPEHRIKKGLASIGVEE